MGKFKNAIAEIEHIIDQLRGDNTDLRAAYEELRSLRVSHRRLLLAVKEAARALIPGATLATIANCRDMLEFAITEAEGPAP